MASASGTEGSWGKARAIAKEAQSLMMEAMAESDLPMAPMRTWPTQQLTWGAFAARVDQRESFWSPSSKSERLLSNSDTWAIDSSWVAPFLLHYRCSPLQNGKLLINGISVT